MFYIIPNSTLAWNIRPLQYFDHKTFKSQVAQNLIIGFTYQTIYYMIQQLHSFILKSYITPIQYLFLLLLL